MPETPVARWVRRRASPPSGAMRYACGSSSFLPCHSRLATNAIVAPCGDQAGWPSFSPQVVSTRGASPEVESSHRLALARFSLIEYDDTHTTAREPSGASETPAGRVVFPRASTLKRFNIGLSLC